MTHLLQVQQLNKSYKNSNFELNDISFTLNPGEVIGLIGKMDQVNPPLLTH